MRERYVVGQTVYAAELDDEGSRVLVRETKVVKSTAKLFRVSDRKLAWGGAQQFEHDTDLLWPTKWEAIQAAADRYAESLVSAHATVRQLRREWQVLSEAAHKAKVLSVARKEAGA